MVVGQHWDNKISDKLDVLVAANEEKLTEQMLCGAWACLGTGCSARHFASPLRRLLVMSGRLVNAIGEGLCIVCLPSPFLCGATACA